jgi:hypothetical protein
MHRATSSLAFVGACLCTRAAAAQPASGAADIPVHVAVDAPDRCADRASFLAQLQARSPRIREAKPDEAARSLRVEVAVIGEHAEGTVAFREPSGGEGRRSLAGADCASVVTGLAFVAAVILDPDAATAPPPAPAVPAPSAAPPPPVATMPAVTPAPALGRGATKAPWRFSVGAALQVGAGEGPDAQIVPRLFLGAELPGALRRFDVRLSAGRGFTRSVATGAGTAAITLTDVRFDPCVNALGPGPIRLDACPLVDLAVLSGQGERTAHAQNATRAVASLGLAVRPGWTYRDRLVVTVAAGTAVPLARYRFYFTSPDTTAYRVAPWSAFGELSVGVRFW